MPEAARGWPTFVLSAQWTDEDGATRVIRRRYDVPSGAQVWPAWLLPPRQWRQEDADQLIRAADDYSARGVVLNPESGWAGATDDEAEALVAYLRARVPLVAVCSYPRADLHPRFPWRGFSRLGSIGLAETYANRGRAYSAAELAACLDSWRAVGFSEVHPMVGMFVRLSGDDASREGAPVRLKTPGELRTDLRQRPAADSLVWGPPSWPRDLAPLLRSWGAGAAPERGSNGPAVVLLLAAAAAALAVSRGA